MRSKLLSKKRRHVKGHYGEALTSNEVYEKLAEEEQQKVAEKKRNSNNKKGKESKSNLQINLCLQR